MEDSVSSLSDNYCKAFYEYHPSVRVIDCTIRDGGLMNKWRFTDDFVRAVYEANVAAGLDYMEIGYTCEGAEDRRPTIF